MDYKQLPEICKLWDYDNPSETEKKFREILPLAKKDEYREYLIELLTQIARAEGLQMKFEDAHKTLDNAFEFLKEDDGKPQVRYLLERGRVFNSSKHYEKARELFLKSYELSKAKDLDYYTVDAAHMMGIVEKGSESLKWNEIAMKHAENSDDKRTNGWLGSLYNNTGWTYHDMGEYEKALNIFEKNVKWHVERGSKRELLIAKWCVARTLRSLGRTSESLEMQLSLLKEFENKGMEQDGYNFEEIGECLLISGKSEEARQYFRKAYELLSVDIWLKENEKERLDRLNNLSR